MHRASGLALVVSFFAAAPASAFCGFYVAPGDEPLKNDATMVVMMRDGTRTVLSMRNDYQGPAEDFAMVVPVPVVLSESDVRTLPAAVFQRVDRLAAPRLVEYWEQDPCARARPAIDDLLNASLGGGRPRRRARRSGGGLQVRVEAQFEVGEYEIVILSADDSSDLETWLRQEHYRIPRGAAAALRPYVQAGQKFFVARVDVDRVRFEDGRAVLSPLRIHYDSDTFTLPVRLGMLNSSGTQDLLVHILSRTGRFEVANYDNVTIPTNFDVRNRTRTAFGSFYAALFDRTRATHPGAVVTEYAWASSSCDPCPGPVLTPQDLLTLGADVGVAPVQRRRGRVRSSTGGYVLTRLHHRYGRGELGEDLVFRVAGPIQGGREHGGPGAQPASSNNFQGRYAIRHRWEGPIACANPIRDRWGGPPRGQTAAVQPAVDTAAVSTRGGLERYLTRAARDAVPARPRRRRPRSDKQASVLPPAPLRHAAACAVHPGMESRAGVWALLVAALVIYRRTRG
ncbi:MAG: DUF2330 domain-containing protein [Sandaracinaceae bacterium]